MKFQFAGKDGIKWIITLAEKSLTLSSNGEGKCASSDLGKVEYRIADIIAKHGSISNPISIQNIESLYFNRYSEHLATTTVKNTIASIRKKVRELLKKAHLEDSLLANSFVSNINRVGYYIGFSVHICESGSKIENPPIAKPDLLKLVKISTKALFLQCQYTFTFSLLAVLLAFTTIYIVQIIYFNKRFHEDSSEIGLVYSKLPGSFVDCVDFESDILSAYRKSSIIDSIAIRYNSRNACLASTLNVLNVTQDMYNRWSKNHSDYIYLQREKNSKKITIRLRVDRINDEYSEFLFSYLINGIQVTTKGTPILSIGNNTGFIVFNYKFSDATTISYYSDSIGISILIMLITTFVLSNLNLLLSSANYLILQNNVSFRLEPVISTHGNKVKYHEILTSFKGQSTLNIISSMRKNGTLLLHTIVLLESITSKNGMRVSVNLCPSTLSGCQFKGIYQKLKSINPDSLVIEITEDSRTDYNQEVLANILSIKKMGFRIAVDDFGVGNNNLNLLNEVKPDYIKIDRVFTAKVDSSQSQQEMARKIIEIAQIESISVIFEGVERKEQSYILSKLGGSNQQGYLFPAICCN